MTTNEREAFEKWWYASKYMQVVVSTGAEEQIAWDGWQARAAIDQRQEVTDGWKLVPNDLSVSMLEAGKTAHFQSEEFCRAELMVDDLPHASPKSMRWRSNRVEYIWHAMLAAAPEYKP